MTWNEYNQRVWRLAGLTETQIAAALARNEKVMPPGWGEQQAVLKQGNTEESAIADGVRAFQFYRQLPRQSQQDIQASLDAEIERENRMN